MQSGEFPKLLTCYCDGSCPDNVQNGTCKVREGGQCYSSVKEVYDDEIEQLVLEYTFGCLSSDSAGVLLQVRIHNESQVSIFN